MSTGRCVEKLKEIDLTLPIEPIQQIRPRARRMGKSISMYDPKKVKDYKKMLAKIASDKYLHEPLKGELIVDLTFARAVQKSVTKSERLKRLSNAHRPRMKPDVDNYIKSTLDGLNGVLWNDDAQIVDLNAHKVYDVIPHVDIRVVEIADY
ncbi:RusA family crossover junction endodeoxyribonuclease [Paucilactobacillus suebicus]|uniref:RusA family crossover junction endodeoxyribonuclease n=1 Tax=Paucilactobacillus suebicus TaxID=152335 RepID=UPI000681C696|nr:RusA family crossover junction endodeoxyribonuclease [Paucilactobacillus suebicus]